MTKQTRAKPTVEPQPNPITPTWDERLYDSLIPYFPEIAGVGLSLTAVILLLAFIGQTKSDFLTAVVSYLNSLAGW
jgi:hypothetical protein